MYNSVIRTTHHTPTQKPMRLKPEYFDGFEEPDDESSSKEPQIKHIEGLSDLPDSISDKVQQCISKLWLTQFLLESSLKALLNQAQATAPHLTNARKKIVTPSTHNQGTSKRVRYP